MNIELEKEDAEFLEDLLRMIKLRPEEFCLGIFELETIDRISDSCNQSLTELSISENDPGTPRYKI